MTVPSVSPELLALQGVVAGRYSIVRELGRGGMGIVFLAREVALERAVAIKLLPPALAETPAHRERFVREAKTAAALAHPNIVPIHSVEAHAAIVFFVMGFIDGETLAERVERDGPLSPAAAIRVIQEVSWALAHAHANGVVHRDVKPENILIDRGTGRAIVTDFGIAWSDDVERTTSRSRIVGTPRYMSPEQASGDAIDGRSDIYSLGAVAWLAATGRPPVDGSSPTAILAKVITERIPSIGSVRRGLPSAFVRAVDRCLAKDPAARWQAAEQLAAAMGSVAGTTLEIAQPVRGFIRTADAIGGELSMSVTVAGTSFVMAALCSVAAPSSNYFAGLANIFIGGAFLMSGTLMSGVAAWRLSRLVADARRLLREGYAHSALRSALADEAGANENGELAPPVARTVLGTIAGIGVTAVSFWLTRQGGTIAPMAGIVGSVVAPAMTIRSLAKRTQGSTSLWTRLMRGAFGKRVFQLGAFGLDREVIDRAALPTPGEPTSTALGSAIGELFKALPVSDRARFPGLLSLITRLESAAEELRRRTPDPEFDTRSSTIVVALENVRINLLKLHAASASPDDVTRDLEEAARIGEEIDRYLAARDSVERVIRKPITNSDGQTSSL